MTINKEIDLPNKPDNKISVADVFYIDSKLKVKGFANSSISTSNWNRWQIAFPDIVSSLVYIYKSTDQYIEAEQQNHK